MKGEKLWEFKDVSVLNDPWSITVENSSYVFVTSQRYSVVVLEIDGRQGENLLAVMVDWKVVLEYILTNLKTACWLLATMDRLSCIICFKSSLTVKDKVLLYI